MKNSSESFFGFFLSNLKNLLESFFGFFLSNLQKKELRTKTKNSLEAEALDRLSELPESLILEILSLLTMRDVVKTSLLSKRWRELWTDIPCLNFKESVKTLNFVDEAMGCWKGGYIRKFEITIEGTPLLSIVGKFLRMDVSSNLCFDEATTHTVLENTLIKILPIIHHVEAVTLSLDGFKMLGVMQHKYLFSPLSNVKLLEFIGGYGIEPKEVFGLYQIFPKVEKLLIDWKVDKQEMSFYHPKWIYINNYYVESEADMSSFLLQLRIVEITWHSYHSHMYTFLVFLLKRAAMVQKLVMIQNGGNDQVFGSQGWQLRAHLNRWLYLRISFRTVNVVACKK